MKIGAILPHCQIFGGNRRYMELGSVFIKRGIDFTIYSKKGQICDWFDFKGKIEGWKNIKADYILCGDPPSFGILPQATGKVFIYVQAGGGYIMGSKWAGGGYISLYGKYPFIANHRIFLKDFPKAHLVEGGVNTEFFKPNLAVPKLDKSCPTDLTWKEQNPISYRLNPALLEEIDKIIKKFKEKKPRVLYYNRGSKGGDYIKSQLADLDTIELVGFQGLNNNDLLKLYQSADFFVSWESRDGWPNTAVEALSCGLTVVGSGFNCQPFIDNVTIVKSLRQFFMDKDSFTVEKKYHSMEKFSWERVADKLLELFAQKHKEQKKNYHQEWIR